MVQPTFEAPERKLLMTVSRNSTLIDLSLIPVGYFKFCYSPFYFCRSTLPRKRLNDKVLSTKFNKKQSKLELDWRFQMNFCIEDPQIL